MPPESGCVFSVDVVGTVAGVYNNQITVKSDSTPVNATASLTMLPLPPSKGTPSNIPAQTANLPPPPAQALPANAPGQTATLPDNSTDSSNPTTGVFLDQCFCKDAPRLTDREKKLEGIKTLIVTKLQSTPVNAPAKQQAWAALQAQVNGYLQALIMQNLTTFPDTTLFNGNGDPFCGPQKISAGECLDQDYAQHQKVHDASCRAGNWNWQTSWTDVSMLQEEIVGLQLEINAIKETLKHLGCGQQGQIAGTAPPVQPNQACPQFMMLVQNQTTSSFNAGGLNGGSGRSLNNGQGIPVPLVFNDDGTFQGFGSGTDAGSAAGTIPGESVRSQFGHSQSIAASGVIHPGSCSTKPCQPDVMHLVLLGGPSQQMTQAQARGEYNRNMQQTTPTGAARLEFDLPAYIGGSAQKTFFSTPMLSSGMTVNLVQGNNGTQALPMGSSLLYALQQCKVTARPSTAGGGAAGVVPVRENNPPQTIQKSGGTVSNPSTAGIVIPGLEGVPTTATSKPVPSSQNTNIGLVIPGLENGTMSSTAPATHERRAAPPPSTPAGNLKVAVNESFQVFDVAAAPAPHLAVTVNETILPVDTVVPPTPHLAVKVNESFQASDTLVPINNAVTVAVNEAIHVSDSESLLPPVILNVSEGIKISDDPKIYYPLAISVDESIHVSDVDSPSVSSPPQTKPVKQPSIQ